MRTFTLQQSKTEVYTPHGGLALVGHCLNWHTSLPQTARTMVKRHGIPNIELIRTYLGLITLGKSDFEAVESARTDPFFKSAMGIKQSPFSARLRQRFDEDAKALTRSPILLRLDSAHDARDNQDFLSHQQLGDGICKAGLQRTALDGAEAHCPGCACAPPGQAPPPENRDAGADVHGLSPDP